MEIDITDSVNYTFKEIYLILMNDDEFTFLSNYYKRNMLEY